MPRVPLLLRGRFRRAPTVRPGLRGAEMRRFAWAALIAAAVSCRSSAPYTAASVPIATGVAGAFSIAQRKMGGCYATCTNGTVCNPSSGFCEKGGSHCACPGGQACLEDSSGFPRCVPQGLSIFSEQQQASGGITVKPEMGYVPTLPAMPTPERH